MLEDLLINAYRPCVGLLRACKNHVVWIPSEGYIPRGYFGAEGDINEVELVLVLAEPGTPFKGESYCQSGPLEILKVQRQSCTDISGSIFHDNLLKILKYCFPGYSVELIMKKTWITESVLCSTPIDRGANGNIPACVEKECGNRFLAKQRVIFENAFWVTVGGKPKARLASLNIKTDFHIHHPGLPAYNVYRKLM